MVDSEPEEREQKLAIRHKKAKRLLENEKAVFDDHHALALCRQYGFKDGILYLYKKQHMYNEVVEYHMEHSEYKELIQACKQYG